MTGFVPCLANITAADIATAVRTELAAELANMDAPVSEVPTAAEVTTAVWSDPRALTVPKFLGLK